MRTMRVTGRNRRGYPTIGAALVAAARSLEDARILIEPGTYDEQLIVRGNVSLIARKPGTVTIRSAAGQVLDSDGTVRLSGLRFEASAGEAVICRGGSLKADEIDVETRGHITLWAAPGTRVEARASTFRGGRVLFAGAAGTVEGCELFGCPDNAIAVIEGARLDVRDCRIERPRHSAVRVEAGSSVTILAGRFVSCHDTMIAVIGAAARAEIDGTFIEDTGTAIGFAEGAAGSVRNVTVRRARHAFSSRSGANPTVSDSAFLDCVETGINISERGAGTFSDCVIRDPGAIGILIKGESAGVGHWGAVDVSRCTVEGSSVGIVLEGAEGRFRDCRLSRLSFAGVRLLEASSATFDALSVTDTPVGLDARGMSAGTFRGAKISECRPLAVSAVDQSRLIIAESVVADSGAGAGVQGSASLVVKGCELRDLESFGMIAMATSTLVVEGSRLLGPGAIGVIGLHDAFIDVRDTTVTDAADIGFRLLDKCSGQIAGCTVTAAAGLAVTTNDYVRVVGLTSSLRTVTTSTASAKDAIVAHVTNIYNTPMFFSEFSGQMAMGNGSVEQIQERGGEER